MATAAIPALSLIEQMAVRRASLPAFAPRRPQRHLGRDCHLSGRVMKTPAVPEMLAVIFGTKKS
jgi:hypothetical protein